MSDDGTPTEAGSPGNPAARIDPDPLRKNSPPTAGAGDLAGDNANYGDKCAKDGNASGQPSILIYAGDLERCDELRLGSPLGLILRSS